VTLQTRVRSTLKCSCRQTVARMERAYGPAAAKLYSEAMAKVEDEIEAAVLRCDVTGILAIRNRVEREVLLLLVEMRGPADRIPSRAAADASAP